MSVTINGTNGLTFNDASTQNTAATGFGFKNRIINGDMAIDQRNAGASFTQTTSSTYTLDRWAVYGSVNSKFSIQQNAGSVTPPVGFKNYLGITSLAATSVGSSDFYQLQQPIEGLNTYDLGWGTANAKPVTLSFWVYSSLTGTFGGSLVNSSVNRSYPYSYSVSAANTWTQVNITIPGDTSGTWLTTNGIGIRVYFGLGVGSGYSGTAGSWAGADYRSATGATSVVGTNGATFYITGVQLEKGSTATSFDYRPYGTELALCQRYYYKVTATGYFPSCGTVRLTSATRNVFAFPVSMRAVPTSLDTTGTASNYALVWGGNTSACNAVPTLNDTTTTGGVVGCTTGDSMTVGQAVILQNNTTSSYLAWSAEL